MHTKFWRKAKLPGAVRENDNEAYREELREIIEALGRQRDRGLIQGASHQPIDSRGGPVILSRHLTGLAKAAQEVLVGETDSSFHVDPGLPAEGEDA